MDVQKRIESLERERWLYLALGLFGALAGLAGAGMAVFKGGPSGSTISAQSFVVRDTAGKTRGTFGLNQAGEPFLTLYSATNTPQAEMSVGATGKARIMMFDTQGKPRHVLGFSNLDPSYQQADANGKVMLTLVSSSSGKVTLMDPSSGKSHELTVDSAAKPPAAVTPAVATPPAASTPAKGPPALPAPPVGTPPKAGSK